jgi:hypothetical protein
VCIPIRKYRGDCPFNEAWGKKERETLRHKDIIIHLRKALDNWIKFEKEKT